MPMGALFGLKISIQLAFSSPKSDYSRLNAQEGQI